MSRGIILRSRKHNMHLNMGLQTGRLIIYLSIWRGVGKFASQAESYVFCYIEISLHYAFFCMQYAFMCCTVVSTKVETLCADIMLPAVYCTWFEGVNCNCLLYFYRILFLGVSTFVDSTVGWATPRVEWPPPPGGTHHRSQAYLWWETSPFKTNYQI